MLAALRSLSVLEVEGNPFCSLPHARAYIVHVLPTLQVLDGDAVTIDEREQARRRFLDAGVLQDAVRIVRAAARPQRRRWGPLWNVQFPLTGCAPRLRRTGLGADGACANGPAAGQ